MEREWYHFATRSCRTSCRESGCAGFANRLRLAPREGAGRSSARFVYRKPVEVGRASPSPPGDATLRTIVECRRVQTGEAHAVPLRPRRRHPPRLATAFAGAARPGPGVVDRQCDPARVRGHRRPVPGRTGRCPAAGRGSVRRRADLHEDRPLPGRPGAPAARGGHPGVRDPRQPRRAVEDHPRTGLPGLGEAVRRAGRGGGARSRRWRPRRRDPRPELRAGPGAGEPAAEIPAAGRRRGQHRPDAHQPGWRARA